MISTTRFHNGSMSYADFRELIGRMKPQNNVTKISVCSDACSTLLDTVRLDPLSLTKQRVQKIDNRGVGQWNESI